MQFIIILLIGILMFRIVRNFVNRPVISNKKFSCYYLFGVPGSGKSTTLAMFAKKIDDENKRIEKFNNKLLIKSLKKYKNDELKSGSFFNKHKKQKFNIYSNANLVDINYRKIDVKNDVGKYCIENGYLLIDEASIEYNNRMMKQFTYDAIKYFKEHRHFKVSILVFSQAYDDVDIVIRRLCPSYFYIKKSPLYFLTKSIVLKKVNKIIDIKKDDKQIIDGYTFQLFGKYIYNGSKYFKYFNSYERYYLPPFPDEKDKGVNII